MRVQVRLPQSAIDALGDLSDDIGAAGTAEAVRWLLAEHLGLAAPLRNSYRLGALSEAAADKAERPIRTEIPDRLLEAIQDRAASGEAISATVRRLIYEAASP